MGTSTTWTDSTLLNRASARRRQHLNGLARSASGSKLPLVIAAFAAGLIIGLPVLGWWLWPVDLANANPSQLSPAYREAYVAMVADSYALNGDLSLAQARLGAWAPSEVAGILQDLHAEATAAGSPVQAKRLQQMLSDLDGGFGTAVSARSAEPAAVNTAAADDVARTAKGLAPVALLAMGAIGLAAGAYVARRQGKLPDIGSAIARVRTLKFPDIRLPFASRAATPSGGPATEVAAAPAAPRASEAPAEDEISLDQALSLLAEEIEVEEEETPAAPASVAGPSAKADVAHVVGNYTVTYRHGTGEPFDTSYSIETDSGEFLGECGVGVAETFGDTSPERVCAMEVWLFDKSDIRTTTKVIASDYALQDPDTRNAVSGRGDATRAQAGQSIVLETASLRLQVDMVGMVYAQSPDAPPKSYFQELTLDLTATRK